MGQKLTSLADIEITVKSKGDSTFDHIQLVVAVWTLQESGLRGDFYRGHSLTDKLPKMSCSFQDARPFIAICSQR